MRNRKLIFLFCAGLFIAMVAVGALFFQGVDGALFIRVAPTDAIIRINNKTYTSGEHRVKAGQYELEISMDGFKPIVKTIIVAKGERVEVNEILEPDSPSMDDWYINHPDDEYIVEGISSMRYDEQSAELTARLPILGYLPVEGNGYLIEYGFSGQTDADDFYLLVTAGEGRRNLAIIGLDSIGFNPAEYRIVFQDFVNPFGSKQ